MHTWNTWLANLPLCMEGRFPDHCPRVTRLGSTRVSGQEVWLVWSGKGSSKLLTAYPTFPWPISAPLFHDWGTEAPRWNDLQKLLQLFTKRLKPQFGLFIQIRKCLHHWYFSRAWLWPLVCHKVSLCQFYMCVALAWNRCICALWSQLEKLHFTPFESKMVLMKAGGKAQLSADRVAPGKVRSCTPQSGRQVYIQKMSRW